MAHLKRVYEVAAAATDDLVAALAEAGTTGIEELPAAGDVVRLAAWFVAGAIADVALPATARLVAESTVQDEDWMAGFRAAAQPVAVGERFVIDPREPPPSAARAAAAPPTSTPWPHSTPHPPDLLPLEGQGQAQGASPPDLSSPDIPGDRVLLRIPARSAFGTGSHASTRLALRLLERIPLSGCTLLDVGTGSGVLALAARALGARLAVGLDVDLDAALLAGQHARINAIGASFWAGSLAAVAAGARFDAVVVNALPHEILPEASAVAAALAPDGRLVISGVLASEGEATLAAWARLGLVAVDTLAEEEWAGWSLARVGAAG
jgi:ribosomal protein L11 methylase PrmA